MALLIPSRNRVHPGDKPDPAGSSQPSPCPHQPVARPGPGVCALYVCVFCVCTRCVCVRVSGMCVFVCIWCVCMFSVLCVLCVFCVCACSVRVHVRCMFGACSVRVRCGLETLSSPPRPAAQSPSCPPDPRVSPKQRTCAPLKSPPHFTRRRLPETEAERVARSGSPSPPREAQRAPRRPPPPLAAGRSEGAGPPCALPGPEQRLPRRGCAPELCAVAPQRFGPLSTVNLKRRILEKNQGNKINSENHRCCGRIRIA